MQTLNTIKPKQATTQFDQEFQAKLLEKMLHDLNKPQQPKYKYLDKATLERHMEELHNMEFRRLATPEDLNACNESAKGFTYVIPHVDRYKMLMQKIDISSDEVLKRGYKSVDWDNLPEQNKNQIRRAAKEYMKKTNTVLRELLDFVERQSWHLDKLTDDAQVEMLLDLEPNEVEVKNTMELRTYLKPGQTSEAYWQPVTELCRQLALLSKGMLYFTPKALATELQKRGFTYETRQHRGKAQHWYWVELVK